MPKKKQEEVLCAVTNEPHSRDQMLRFVYGPNGVVFDPTDKLKGEEFFICAKRELVEAAEKTGIFTSRASDAKSASSKPDHTSADHTSADHTSVGENTNAEKTVGPVDQPFAGVASMAVELDYSERIFKALQHDSLRALAMANKVGAIHIGLERFKRPVAAVLESMDMAQKSSARVKTLADAEGAEHFKCFSASAMGNVFSRETVAHALLLKVPIAQSVVKRIRRFGNYG